MPASPVSPLVPSTVPPRIAAEMTCTIRRHLPRGSWDPGEDPAWTARHRVIGRANALRALRYAYPAWSFEIRRCALVVERKTANPA